MAPAVTITLWRPALRPTRSQLEAAGRDGPYHALYNSQFHRDRQQELFADQPVSSAG